MSTIERSNILFLSQSGDWILRAYVAMDPSTPSDILASLVMDFIPTVRDNAAKNSSTPFGNWHPTYGRILP